MNVSKMRWIALGDPQTTFERFLGVLEQHQLLDANLRLRSDVGLVSMGDHFDFDPGDMPLSQVSTEGIRILEWLEAHPRTQVVILFGNHDAARVMELAHETDETFAKAREHARSFPETFTKAFPRIPTADIALRDYSSFTEAQRAIVQKLLMNERMQLAAVGYRGGRAMLLTHAGVTVTEVANLDVPVDPLAIAQRLNERLRDAVARARDAWTRGDALALSLAPLHAAGSNGQEGAGLLYHRPSQRGAPANGEPRRRYHPRDLPAGLVQVCGHTGHHKCLKELAPEWITPRALETRRGGIRTLTAGDDVHYDVGVAPPSERGGTLYLIDIELNAREVDDFPVFELDDVQRVTE